VVTVVAVAVGTTPPDAAGGERENDPENDVNEHSGAAAQND
jgi:hypothetical protein